MLYLASDHGGFELKNKIKNYLEKKELKYIDLGPQKFDPNDDYPLYAEKLGKAVVDNHAQGIGICGSGIGMSIALNKIRGVRAAKADSVYDAEFSKLDNDSNILVLGGRTFDENTDWPIIDTWLKTEFSGADRHLRRVNEIKAYEETN